MKRLAIIFGLAALLAAPAAAEKETPSISSLVDSFYVQLALDKTDSKTDHDCDGTSIECAEAACNRVSTFDCDDDSEIRQVTRACRGNYGEGCLNAVCNRVSTFDCDDLNEVVSVANACRGNRGGRCVEWVCSRLSTFDCDDLDEVLPIARECGGTEPRN